MSVSNVIKLVLPEITEDEVEDYLATDDLFIDYFNTFLALPAFPEPLCFNKVTGGFEVVSHARKQLTQKIKVAVKSQKITPRMYRVARKHCYSEIPLLSLQPAVEQKDEEIETSFNVMTLNKEQGIHWVKEERLPAFLQSDCYREYRLAKLLSQVKISGPNGEYIIMELDYTPEQKKSMSDSGDIETNPMDDKMQELYVSMGCATLSQTEAWYSSVVNYNPANVVYSTGSIHAPSAFGDQHYRKLSGRRSSGRPCSVFSNREVDSGYVSPAKSLYDSRFGSAQGSRRTSHDGSMKIPTFETPVLPFMDEEGKILPTTNVNIPSTPRPSGKVCVVWPNYDDEYHPPVYYKESEAHKRLSVFTSASDQSFSYSIVDGEQVRKIEKKLQNYAGTIDEAGALLVSEVLRSSLATIHNIPLIELPNIPEIDAIVNAAKPMPKDLQENLAAIQTKNNVVVQEIYRSSYHSVFDTPLMSPTQGVVMSPTTSPMSTHVSQKFTPADSQDLLDPTHSDLRRVNFGAGDDDDVPTETTETPATIKSALKKRTSVSPSASMEADGTHTPGSANTEHVNFASPPGSANTEHVNFIRISNESTGSVSNIHEDNTRSSFDDIISDSNASNVHTPPPKSTTKHKPVKLQPLVRDQNTSNVNPPPSKHTAKQDKLKTVEIQPFLYDTNASNRNTPSPKRTSRQDTLKTVRIQPPIRLKKTISAASDADSLLDSDEEYEPQDDFFHSKNKHKFGLNDKQGIHVFKKFLAGTVGEKHWNLWLDIDRASLVTDRKSENVYVAWMSKRYQLPGAKYELSLESKIRVGLTDTVWTLPLIKSVQNKVAEPLILYWATRFLLDQPPPRPYPPVTQPITHRKPTLLPHRPHTCRPRLQHTNPLPESHSTYWKPVKEFSQGFQPTHPDIDAPNVRMMLKHPVGTKSTWLSQLDYCMPRAGFTRGYHPDSLNQLHPLQHPHPAARSLRSPTARSLRAKSAGCKSPNQLRAQAATPDFLTPKMIVERLKKSRERGSSARPSSTTASIADIPTHPGARPTQDFPTHPGTRPTSPPPHSPRSVSPHVFSSTPTTMATKLSTKDDAKSDNEDDGIGSSASSHHSTDSGDALSEFQGGRRMDALLNALYHEHDSGGFFRSFVERSENQLWIDSLDLWHAIQDHHALFYEDIMDEYTVSRKSRAIFATYIVDGGPNSIKCPGPMSNSIYHALSPPYEDLFDQVEEMALDILFLAWIDMISQDMATYTRVQLVEVKRHIETKSKFVLNLQKRGILKEQVMTPEDPMANYTDPVYDPSLIDKIPEECRDFTLDKLLRNRIEMEHFRDFLAVNYASMDLQCWMDIEAFRRLSPVEEKRCDNKAKEIRLKYLNKKYFFGASSPAGKTGQDAVMAAGGGWGKLLDDRPPNAVILEAQKYVAERLEKKWLRMFMATPGFADRQKPHSNLEDVTEDAVMQRRRKTHNMLKLMESKWISSAKDIITFRKALQNPVTSYNFRRFVSIKGDTLENDVLFWLEVQKYKEIHQSGCDDALLTQKIGAIINCFIDSYIPPAIQIDVSPEQAEKIIDRKHEKGPYLFRDAQMTVFRIIFSHWPDFCDYRGKVTEDKILTTIERRRKQAKKVERARQRQFEEQERIRQEYMRSGEGDAFDQLDNAPSETGDEPVIPGEKDSVSWTYGHYVEALKHEQMMNNAETASRTSTGLGDETGSLKSALTETKRPDMDTSDTKQSVSGQLSSEKIDEQNISANNSFNGLERRASKSKNGKKSKRGSIVKKQSLASIK